MTQKGRSREGIERGQGITKYTLMKSSKYFSIKAQVDSHHVSEEHCKLKEDKFTSQKLLGR